MDWISGPSWGMPSEVAQTGSNCCDIMMQFLPGCPPSLLHFFWGGGWRVPPSKASRVAVNHGHPQSFPVLPQELPTACPYPLPFLSSTEIGEAQPKAGETILLPSPPMWRLGAFASPPLRYGPTHLDIIQCSWKLVNYKMSAFITRF